MKVFWRFIKARVRIITHRYNHGWGIELRWERKCRATLKNSNGFALKNSSDATVTVGESPSTLNTRIRLTGATKAQTRLVH